MAPRLAVRDIALFERPVRFARPFRFGAVIVNAAPQAFVRVEIEVEGKGRATGASAEFLVPKWFDKRPHLSPDETVDELRRSLLIARELYLAHSDFRYRVRPARGVHRCAGRGLRQRRHPAAGRGLRAGRDRQGHPRCAAARGGRGFLRRHDPNIAGIDARLSPDLQADEIAQFLADRGGSTASRSGTPSGSTTGSKARVALPTQQENAGARYFKLKLNGDPEHDAARLIRIGSELATLAL